MHPPYTTALGASALAGPLDLDRGDRVRELDAGGFYIIEAEGLEAALGWASKTSAAIGMPIEVWPFQASHT
ncbi:MAG: hypothetical protein ACR2K4_03895 [Candidatus Limnocylindria bacterium]